MITFIFHCYDAIKVETAKTIENSKLNKLPMKRVSNTKNKQLDCDHMCALVPAFWKLQKLHLFCCKRHIIAQGTTEWTFLFWYRFLDHNQESKLEEQDSVFPTRVWERNLGIFRGRGEWNIFRDRGGIF